MYIYILTFFSQIEIISITYVWGGHVYAFRLLATMSWCERVMIERILAKKNKGKKWKVNLAILCLGTQWNPSVVVIVTEAHAPLWCAFFRLAELVNGIVRADDAWCFQEDETVWRAAMARVLFSRSERALAYRAEACWDTPSSKAPQVRPTSHGVWLHNACKTVPLSREWQTTFKK